MKKIKINENEFDASFFDLYIYLLFNVDLKQCN